MSSDEPKTISKDEEEQTPTYFIRSIEVKRGISYDVGNVHYTASTGLTAEVPSGTHVAFFTNCLERFCDERNRRLLEERPQTPQRITEDTVGLPFNPEGLHFNQSVKKPDLFLSSQDCELYRQVLEHVITHGPIFLRGFSYFKMPDGITIGRRKVT